MTELLRVTVYDGKYTVIQTDTGLLALRHGEEWRDLTGDGLVLALAQEVEELRQKIEASKRETTEQTEVLEYFLNFAAANDDGEDKHFTKMVKKGLTFLAKATGRAAA